MKHRSRAWGWLDARRAISRARPPLLLLVWLSATLGWAGAASAGSEVYTVRHRVATELLPIVELSLGEGASATVDTATNSIVLLGPDASRRDARSLLERLDVARRSVMLRVVSRSSRGLRGAGYRVEWSNHGAAITVGRLIDAKGAAPAPGFTAKGRALSTARDDTFRTSLRVLDGETGRIEMGRSVPVTDRRLFGSTTTFAEASSGLLASPHVLGEDRVQLELAHYEGDVSAEARTQIMQSATTVVIQQGEVVVLGTLMQRGSAAGQDIFERQTRSESLDDRVLLLSVEIE